MTDWMLGASWRLAGDQARAIRHCRAAVSVPPTSRRINTVRYGTLDRCCAFGALAHALWLGGYPDQAAGVARDCLEEAAASDHPIVLCIALVDTVSVFVWNGDLGYSAEIVDQLLSRAGEHALAPDRAVGLGRKGEVEFRRGHLESGIALMRGSLKALSADRHEILGLEVRSHLAEALAATGDFETALALIETALTETQARGGSYRLPELLRVKAEILALTPRGSFGEVEDCLKRSIALARRQSALAWELRTTTTLARFWAKRGRRSEARETLGTVYKKFTEGFDAVDLETARRVLDELAQS